MTPVRVGVVVLPWYDECSCVFLANGMRAYVLVVDYIYHGAHDTHIIQGTFLILWGSGLPGLGGATREPYIRATSPGGGSSLF